MKVMKDFQSPVSREPVAHSHLSPPCRPPSGFKACFVYEKDDYVGCPGRLTEREQSETCFIEDTNQSQDTFTTKTLNEFSGWLFLVKINWVNGTGNVSKFWEGEGQTSLSVSVGQRLQVKFTMTVLLFRWGWVNSVYQESDEVTGKISSLLPTDSLTTLPPDHAWVLLLPSQASGSLSGCLPKPPCYSVNAAHASSFASDLVVPLC